MTTILAIDPGPAESAFLKLVDGRPVAFGIRPNDEMLATLRLGAPGAEPVDVVAIEQIEPRYGLNPGWETLDTARWVGRFEEASHPTAVARLNRSVILRHLGVVTQGKNRTSADSGVRSALMDRFGGSSSIRKGGPLYKVTTHVWAALAVAVTWADQELE